MKARARIPVYVVGPDGRPFAGAQVYVRTDPGGADATIYAARTGGATLPNPQSTDARGRIAGYLERDDYAATVTAPALGDPWVEAFEAIPGAAESIDADWLDDDGVTAGAVAQRQADGSISWATIHAAGTYAARPPIANVLEGTRYFATDKAMEWQAIAGAWVLIRAESPRVTALPTAPIDGQRCTYLTDTAGTYGGPIPWPLRYRAFQADGVTPNPSTYKWEVEGSPPALEAVILTAQNVAAAGWVDLATSGPAIPAPLAGDYEVFIAAQLWTSSDGSMHAAILANGETAPADESHQITNVHAINKYQTPSRIKRKNGVLTGGGNAIRMRYNGSVVPGSFAASRVLRVRPIRVG